MALLLFILFNSSIAFIPNGVAALPIDSALLTKFKEIYCNAKLSFSKLLNNGLIIKEVKLPIIFNNPLLLHISNIPPQNINDVYISINIKKAFLDTDIERTQVEQKTENEKISNFLVDE
jgi:hypothetical protein